MQSLESSPFATVAIRTRGIETQSITARRHSRAKAKQFFVKGMGRFAAP